MEEQKLDKILICNQFHKEVKKKKKRDLQLHKCIDVIFQSITHEHTVYQL